MTVAQASFPGFLSKAGPKVDQSHSAIYLIAVRNPPHVCVVWRAIVIFFVSIGFGIPL